MRNPDRTHTMAVFCDFENLALGVRDAKYDKFDMGKVLERLLVKGSIVVKKAYCDWERYREFKKAMHEAAFEMIEIPHLRMSGKNSADIRMVVDALDLCYTKAHVDTFIIVSGDSDFSPLVSKLRENNKTVIGVGVKNSTSDLFIGNCDEFIFYDDLVREQQKRRSTRLPRATATPSAPAAENGEKEPRPSSRAPSSRTSAAKTAAASSAPAAAQAEARPALADPKPAGDPEKAIEMLMETVDALIGEQGGDQGVWGWKVKETIKRRTPQFSERFHGFRSFNALLEAAGKRGLLDLVYDDRSGGYRLRLGAVIEAGDALPPGEE
ncbi:NYN domain-containing protein [Prosthecobacter sp. SYSU 5D2]|uniref:NYN domain-containing protein n=1 Tax=Prosthecobacter sp. SYSU 5D2 TaxID=3134134 RepID=UPI0031FF2D31